MHVTFFKSFCLGLYLDGWICFSNNWLSDDLPLQEQFFNNPMNIYAFKVTPYSSEHNRWLFSGNFTSHTCDWSRSKTRRRTEATQFSGCRVFINAYSSSAGQEISKVHYHTDKSRPHDPAISQLNSEIEVFVFVTPCSVMVGYQRFGGPYCLHFITTHTISRRPIYA